MENDNEEYDEDIENYYYEDENNGYSDLIELIQSVQENPFLWNQIILILKTGIRKI